MDIKSLIKICLNNFEIVTIEIHALLIQSLDAF